MQKVMIFLICLCFWCKNYATGNDILIDTNAGLEWESDNLPIGVCDGGNPCKNKGIIREYAAEGRGTCNVM